ncbi:MAG: aminodeoxychorismate synthase component I, partial [Bacteroidota bacterium]
SELRRKHPEWMFGWLSYDLKNEIESLESANPDPVGLPDMYFFVPGVLLEVDRKGRSIRLIRGHLPTGHPASEYSPTVHVPPEHYRPEHIPAGPASPEHIPKGYAPPEHVPCDGTAGKQIPHARPHPTHEPDSTRSKSGQYSKARITSPLTSVDGWERYHRNAEKVKEYIARGDTYEVNLTHQLQAGFEGDSLDQFYAMRDAGPVPFAAWMSHEGIEVCCASPERFLERDGNRIRSQPIKGTSPRGADPEQDRKIVNDILKKEKNRAENVMIVDLVRHDMGRVARTGSVKTEALLEVQTFSTVHQLVSTITAEVTPNTPSVDIIMSCFPMGSMTGAPKIRTMEIIDELESYRRGLYSGAIGYFKPNDDFDFNVVIRTAIIKGKKLYYPVGGAITADSDAAEEWEESWLKARALAVPL